MTMLPLLAQTAGLTAVIALLWLVTRAFRRHLVWGFAVLLFSPVSATCFGIKYWREEKAAFITYIGTFVTATALGLHLFTTWGGWELLRVTYQVQQEMESRTLTRENAEVFMKTRLAFNEKSGISLGDQRSMDLVSRELARLAAEEAVEETAAAEARAQSSLDKEKATKNGKPGKVRYRLVYIPIKISEAKNHVGSTVKVIRKNVSEREYRLIGAAAGKIELSQRAGHGSYSFHYKNRDIKKIRVLTRQPY